MTVQIEEMREWVERGSLTAPAVSAWSVGEHIEHCCLAMIGITRALARSEPPPPRAGKTMTGWMILTTGRIPRGRAQAPREVTPAAPPDGSRLRALLDEAEAGVRAARELDPGTWFRHFALGVLRRDQSLRFLDIHNRHHLKIARDIATAGGA